MIEKTVELTPRERLKRRVKVACAYRGTTVAGVALMLGVKTATIYALLNGKSSSVRLALRVAEILEIPVAEIYEGLGLPLP